MSWVGEEWTKHAVAHPITQAGATVDLEGYYKAGFSAALRVVGERMPPTAETTIVHAQGWNQYARALHGRLAELSGETQP